MTIDDFFKECEGKGAIPLSYKSHKKFANGSRTVEYENPKYKKAKEKIAKILGMEDEAFSGLYGQEVMIKTKNGYHYGILKGLDEKGFRLENYLFNERKMDLMGYYTSFSPGFDDTVIPAEGIVSISRIPDIIGAFA